MKTVRPALQRLNAKYRNAATLSVGKSTAKSFSSSVRRCDPQFGGN